MPDRQMEIDVLVIGAGPAGATCARLLAGHGKQVVMVDSGPQLRGRPGEHFMNCFRYQLEPNLSLDDMYAQREVYSVPCAPHDVTVMAPGGANSPFTPALDRLNYGNPEQNPNLNMPNAAIMYAVGGMFSLWSAYAPDPEPMERTPLIPADEWESILAVARRLFNVRRDAFAASAVKRAVCKVLAQSQRVFADPAMAAAPRGTKSGMAHFVDWTGVDTILGPLLDAEGRCVGGLRILPEHRAEKIILKGDRVDLVVTRNLRSLDTVQFRADTVIVAGGGFLTPRLLWQAQIRPPALGRYLSENTVATCQVALNDKLVDVLRNDPDNPACAAAVPVAWSDASPKCSFATTPAKPWMGHIDRIPYTMTYNLPYDVRLTLSLTWYGMVEQVPENRVTFSEKWLDRFGMPQITIEYRLGPDDAQRARDMLTDLAATVPLLGAPVPLSRPPFTVGPTLQPPGTSMHFMGTCRMGSDKQTSVVDPDGKVWDTANLYIAGSSVIPNRMASNCTLAASAIAVRTAAKILGCTLADLERDVGVTSAPGGGG